MRPIALTTALTSLLILSAPIADAGDNARFCRTPDRNPIGLDYKVWVDNNCKRGDIIEVWAADVPFLCDFDEPAINTGERTACVYRGERRRLRVE